MVYRDLESIAGIPNAAIEVLENMHLIRKEVRAGAHWYEPTHDRFIKPILSSNKVFNDERAEIERAVKASSIMRWYGLDAVDRAFSRTRKALLEPFDFWKWAKIAIIIFLVPIGFLLLNKILLKYSNSSAVLILPFLFFHFLIYVSNVMEIVFVESLVRNEVKFWNYSRRFLGKAFYLMLRRLALGMGYSPSF